MFDQGPSTGSPQFGTAEYKSSPAGDVCRVCGQALPGIYYRANRAMVCAGCIERVRASIPQDGHSAFMRGILFGVGGFVVGLILYAGFTILTGIEIGFVSLAVGWLVGKAIRMGSGGIGGRRYQIAAVILTYAAVSMASIPIAIHYELTHEAAETETQQSGASANGKSGQALKNPDQKSRQEEPQESLGVLLGRIIFVGLAGPFLQLESGVSGVIGLIILFVGIQFAWRLTAGPPKIVIDGPFDNSKSIAT